MIVTGTLPGDRGVGAIVLRDLVKRFDQRIPLIVSFVDEACAQDVTEGSRGRYSPLRLPWPDLSFHPSRGLRKLRQFCGLWLRTSKSLEKAVDKSVSLALQHSIDRVIVVLDGAAAMSVGWRVAERLKVPLLAYVWDHGPYLLRQQKLNRLLLNRFRRDFDQSLRRAERGAVVSETMQSDYRERYGLDCVLLRHGVIDQGSHAGQAAGTERVLPESASPRPWIIGFAGTDYARSAWECLLAALDRLEWRLGGRPVIFRVTGTSLRVTAHCPRHIEFLGYFDSPEEALACLRESDLNFLSHPFEKDWYEFSRYSFPTKLSSYVAAGAPVLVHAPPHSSLDAFARRYPMGPHCDHLDPERLAHQLKAFAESPQAVEAARNGVAAVARDELNAERFFSAFAEFIGTEV